MLPVISVKPTSITLELGETAQVQIDTNVTNFNVVNHNEEVCYFDKKHLEVKGLSIGYNQIDLIAELDGEIAKASIAITVEDVKSEGKVRYMIHNRPTNRLVTGIANKIDELDLTFWLGDTVADKGEMLTDGMDLNTISTPVIINPVKDDMNFKGIIKVSDFKTALGNTTLKHTHTEWQIATDKNFLNVIHSEIKYRYKLTEYGTKFIGKGYYYRVRYHAGNAVSDWSKPRYIINVDLGMDGLTTELANNDSNTKFYGEIDKTNLIEDFDYRGEYYTLIANNIISFKAGDVVKHNNRLYRCIEDYKITPKNTNENFCYTLHPGCEDVKNMYSPFLLLPYRRIVVNNERIKLKFMTNDDVVSITPTYNAALTPKTWNDNGKLYKEGNNKYTFEFNCHSNGTQAFTVIIILQHPVTKLQYRFNVPYTPQNVVIAQDDTPENANFIELPTSLDDDTMNIVIENDEDKLIQYDVPKQTMTLSANDDTTLTAMNFQLSAKHIGAAYTVYPTLRYPYTGDNYAVLSGGKSCTVTTKRNGYALVTISGTQSGTTYKPYYASLLRRVSGYKTDSKWVIEDRNNLPTLSWLMDRIGIGFGVTDLNYDGYTFGSEKIGDMKNIDEGWLKFLIDGRLIYVYKKPICDTIAWVDIARRDGVYGNRTIKIGSRLYYIRLLKENEYRKCLLSGISGINIEDLELGGHEFIEDLQEGYKRKTINSKGEINEIDPKYRIGDYRPVLELIPEGSEPYNNLPKMPPAEDEVFRYDEYTDTGYFGEVLSSNFTNGDTINNVVGFSRAEGTGVNSDAGWLKFYWHGLFFLLPKKWFRQTVNYDTLYNKNLIHYKDMGSDSKVNFKQNGVMYTLGLIDGLRTEPYDNNDFQNGSDLNSNKWNMPLNIHLEYGKFTKWNELVYRVITPYASGQSTEAGFRNNFGGNRYHTEADSGLQIGDNWASFLPQDLMCKFASTTVGAGFITTTVSTHDHYRSGKPIGVQIRGMSGKDSIIFATDKHMVKVNVDDGYSVNWGPLIYIQKDHTLFANSNTNELEDKDWSKYPNIIPDDAKTELMEYETITDNTKE